VGVVNISFSNSPTGMFICEMKGALQVSSGQGGCVTHNSTAAQYETLVVIHLRYGQSHRE
jgi:hypothetical protein